MLGEEGLSDGYPVQVFTSDGKKRWLSCGSKPHGEIPVASQDSKDEPWHIERDDASPFWSFYTKSAEGKRLYLTYDRRGADTRKVTLEYDQHEGSKEGYFLLLMQPGQGFVIASRSDPKTILGYDDRGFLIMTDAELPITHSEWIISPDEGERPGYEEFEYEKLEAGFFPESESVSGYCEIKMIAAAKKWISTGVKANDQIRVEQNSPTQYWDVSIHDTDITIKVPSQQLSVSTTEESDSVSLEPGEANSNPSLKLVRDSRAGEVKFQAMSNRYVGLSSWSTLQLKEDKAASVAWYLVAYHVVFYKNDETKVIFPQFNLVPAQESI